MPHHEFISLPVVVAGPPPSMPHSPCPTLSGFHAGESPSFSALRLEWAMLSWIVCLPGACDYF